jgi:hypothetical protein
VDDSKKRLTVTPTGNRTPVSPVHKGVFYLREFLKKRLAGRRLPYDSDVKQAIAFSFTENGNSFLFRRLGLGAAVEQTVKL